MYFEENPFLEINTRSRHEKWLIDPLGSIPKNSKLPTWPFHWPSNRETLLLT